MWLESQREEFRLNMQEEFDRIIKHQVGFQGKVLHIKMCCWQENGFLLLCEFTQPKMACVFASTHRCINTWSDLCSGHLGDTS